MTPADARDALVASLEATWDKVTVPVFYENVTDVNLTTIGDYFLKVQIEWNGSAQANVSPTPFERTYGVLVLWLLAKESLGTRQALVYLESLRTLFRFKNFGGVHTQAARLENGPTQQGWCSHEVRVPFYFDSNS